MARLNVAVEAACQTTDLSASPDFQFITWLSIYVTDQNREPVTGLKQTHFRPKYLAPLDWASDSDFLLFEDAQLQLPGVYIIKLTSGGTPSRYTLGVRVRKPKFWLEDRGFGMATAIRPE